MEQKKKKEKCEMNDEMNVGFVFSYIYIFGRGDIVIHE